MPDYDMASEECRYQMDLWDEANAGEALDSPFLADVGREPPALPSRLECMAKMLDSMGSEAGKITDENPGTKKVFEGPPIDLEIFDSCAKVLIKRGKTLKHLRPISEAIYSFVTGNLPSDYWAKRQEDEARRKHETHPQKDE